MVRAALLTLNASDSPQENLRVLRGFLAESVDQGATFILTPEVTNCMSTSRAHQRDVLHFEDDDPTLEMVREFANLRQVWVLIGSLALKTNDADGRFANRSFLISPDGEISARYDKIHMFDVDVSAEETYRESSAYRAGSKSTCVLTSFAKLGMSVCYDLRFPHLYRAMAQAGADILTVPAAFSAVTGQAHWEILLRARAIETGAFILAPAQTGQHGAKGRKTFGHSLAVSPWGEVLFDGGTEVGVGLVDLDLSQVADARRRIPSLKHDRNFEAPT